MSQPLINGEAYTWSQIKLNILDQRIAGVSSISYDEEQEMQNNYGAGNMPVSQGLGRVSYSGSLSLQMEELEALQNAAPNRRLQAIPAFDIVVSFIPEGGSNIVNHTLKACRFKNNGREISEGDQMIEKEIELLVGFIKW